MRLQINRINGRNLGSTGTLVNEHFKKKVEIAKSLITNVEHFIPFRISKSSCPRAKIYLPCGRLFSTWLFPLIHKLLMKTWHLGTMTESMKQKRSLATEEKAVNESITSCRRMVDQVWRYGRRPTSHTAFAGKIKCSILLEQTNKLAKPHEQCLTFARFFARAECSIFARAAQYG